MKNSLFILTLLLAGPFMLLQAQTENAVINENTTKVTVKSQNSYTVNIHKEILINKQIAEQLADFHIIGNRDMKLENLSCSIATADGKVIKKYKNSDVKQSEFSTELATDAHHYILDVEIPTFPAIITYDITYRQNDNVLSYPSFIPISNFDTSLKHASYSITAPSDVPIQCSQITDMIKPDLTTNEEGQQVIKFEVSDIKPVKDEPYDNPITDYVPMVYVTPQQIDYYKTTASLTSWQEFGKWVWQLTENTNVLPDDIKAKIHSLTDTLSTKREKIAAIYKYLGESTRYVSIQLGIGGFKPMDAESVCRNSFGDCKALSNVMKTMLAEVGVESVYTVISTVYRTLVKDKANFQQLNHAILKVPDSDGDIWIECTNPTIPLGYIHTGIAGHDAVEITAEGGKLITLPDYSNNQNENISDMKMKLHNDGTADISITDSYKFHRYGEMRWLTKASQKEQKDAITDMYKLPFAELKSVDITDESKPYGTPELTIKAEASGVKIANTSGSRLFVTMSPMHSDSKTSTLSRDRFHPLYIEQGKKITESVELEFPEGMSVESISKINSCENELGIFLVETTNDGNKIKLETTLEIRKGSYSKEKVALLDELINASHAAYNLKVILKKE